MGWSSGTYTKGNSATGGWTGDAAGGIGIEAGRHDTQDNDFATGINTCLTKDGQNTPTANLPMGGFKHTGAGDASASNEYMAFGQITNGSTTVNVGSITGAALTVNNTGITSIASYRYSNDAAPGGATFGHSRGATVGAHTIVQSGDVVGRIDFAGSDGTAFRVAARINVEIDGTPGASDMPGRITFNTTTDGGISCPERMRIDNAGRVMVNGVPLLPSQFDITSSTSTRRALTAYSTASGDLSTPAIGISKFDNNSTTSQRFIQFWINDGATTSGGIAANGASQATFVTISDERLKENIIDLPSQLANVMALRPVEYDYKDGSGHQLGFIAQEVLPIYPDLISQDPDGFYNLSGLGKNEARLIKAFQEFAQITQGTIATLEARIAALENA